MLATLLLLARFLAQEAVLPQACPFDGILQLELGPSDPVLEGHGPSKRVDHTVEFSGTLQFWTKVEGDLDTFLRLEDGAGNLLAEDDDSGGTPTPYVMLEVEPGETLLLAVAESQPAGTGKVALHLIAAPETVETRAEAKRAKEVLAARTRLLSPDHPDVFRAKGNLAVTRKELGDLAGARMLEEEVLAGFARVLPTDHPNILIAKQNLAVTRYRLGDLAGAHELDEEVLAARIRLLPPDHPDILAAKSNLSVAKWKLGDLSGAHVLLEEVLLAQTRLLSPDHPDILRTKVNLAVEKGELGDLSSARELQEEVLAARARLLHPEHPELLRAKLNLATTKKLLGDPSGARELEEGVLAARTRLLPPDHPDVLLAKVGLAGTRMELGDLAGAHHLYEEVLTVRTRLLPSDHPDLLAAKQGVALTRKELGDLTGARQLLEEVHEARSRILAPDHPDLLAAKLNLAVMRWELGDFSGGRELAEEVLAVRTRVLTPEDRLVVAAKVSLALIRKEQGDLSGALQLEEEVLSVWTHLLPPGHTDLLAAKRNLAVTKAKLGDAAGAHDLVSSILEGMRARELRADSPRAAREGARFELRHFFGTLFSGESVDSREILAADILVTLENIRHATVASSEVARVQAEHPTLAEKQRLITALHSELNDLAALRPAEAEEVEAWNAEILRLASERDRSEWELRLELAKAGVFVDEITIESVAATLPNDALAVSYLRYPRRLPADPDTRESPRNVDSFLAFLVKPDGEVVRAELGPAEEIEELVLQWRASIDKPVAARGLGVVSAGIKAGAPEQIGEHLRRRILDPILAVAPDARFLHIVLDDALHLVPLDTLPLESGLVGERYLIRTETSLAHLLRPRNEAKADGRLLMLGAIDYDAELDLETDPKFEVATPPLDTLLTFEGDKADRSSAGAIEAAFTYLPGTVEEIGAIACLYEGVFHAKPVVLKDVAANKARLAEKVFSARFLHLATHGWFAQEIFRSQLDREDDEALRQPWLRAEETVKNFAPETLCGLALAGANRGRNEIGRVPGILTAEELACPDLRGCELAVLSACETNVGIRRAGQGIQSLQSALHAAGARTAITSLWKVDDSATRKLMELFYTYLWVDKMPKAEALWRAKMALRAEEHPLRDWAAWVLSGDP